MFLAFKEIKREKLRYGLIILMIFLISYLIFMLSSLAALFFRIFPHFLQRNKIT